MGMGFGPGRRRTIFPHSSVQRSLTRAAPSTRAVPLRPMPVLFYRARGDGTCNSRLCLAAPSTWGGEALTFLWQLSVTFPIARARRPPRLRPRRLQPCA